MYFFNITNSDQIVNLTDVSQLNYEQVGPYVYDEFRWKEDIEFREDGNVAKFVEKKKYTFNQTLSGNRSSDDILTVINLIFVSQQTILKFHCLEFGLNKQ